MRVEGPSSGRPNGESAIRTLAIGAFVVAVAYFVWRGPWRGVSDSGDLTYGYAAAQAWLVGTNPYDAVVLAANIVKGGGPVVPMAIGHGVYFPTSIPLFLPISVAPWSVAVLIGVALNVAGGLGIALGLTRWLGWRPTSTLGLAMIAFILALGPIHTTISAGQTGVVATACVVAAMLLEQSGRATWAGVGYGLASAVKIQIGLPFVAHILWRRRWSASAATGAVLGGLTLLAVVRMAWANVPWLDTWLANLAWLTGPEGNGSPGPENPDRFSLINLEYPLRAFLPEPWAMLAAVVLVGGAALAMVALIRGRRPSQEHLALSIMAVLGLLVTYHRYYDAVALAIPIAWAFSVLSTPLRSYGIAVLALCSPFIVPLLGALREVEAAGHLPPWLTGSVVWNGIILPHHAWALVLIVVVLLSAAWRKRGANVDFQGLPETISGRRTDASGI